MTRRSTPRLRVAPPTLEPDPVLLHQLATLGARSSPTARTARFALARALTGAAAVAVIGGTTWVAGATPGSDPTVGPAVRATQEATGATSPGGDVEAPFDVTPSEPGSPWSPGLPGKGTSTAGAPDRTGAPREPGQQPPNDSTGNTGMSKGRGDGTGNGHGRGHAYGHVKTPPGADRSADRRSDKSAGRSSRHSSGRSSDKRSADNGRSRGHDQRRVPAHSQGRGQRQSQPR